MAHNIFIPQLWSFSVFVAIYFNFEEKLQNLFHCQSTSKCQDSYKKKYHCKQLRTFLYHSYGHSLSLLLFILILKKNCKSYPTFPKHREEKIVNLRPSFKTGTRKNIIANSPQHFYTIVIPCQSTSKCQDSYKKKYHCKWPTTFLYHSYGHSLSLLLFI